MPSIAIRGQAPRAIVQLLLRENQGHETIVTQRTLFSTNFKKVCAQTKTRRMENKEKEFAGKLSYKSESDIAVYFKRKSQLSLFFAM